MSSMCSYYKQQKQNNTLSPAMMHRNTDQNDFKIIQYKMLAKLNKNKKQQKESIQTTLPFTSFGGVSIGSSFSPSSTSSSTLSMVSADLFLVDLFIFQVTKASFRKVGSLALHSSSAAQVVRSARTDKSSDALFLAKWPRKQPLYKQQYYE